MGSSKKSKKSKKLPEKSKSSKKSSKKVRKQFRPTSEQKIEILKKCKMWNKALWGKFPEGKSFNDRAKKRKEMVAFVKEKCETPSKFAWPNFDRSFKKWKSDFVKMVTKSKETGKSPSKPLTTEQHLLYDICGENIEHQKNIKVRQF